MFSHHSRIKPFIYLIGLFGVLLILSSCRSEEKVVRKTEVLLDTVVTATLFDGDQEDLDALFSYLEEKNKLFDRFAESPLSTIGTQPTEVPQDLFTALEHALSFSQESDGAFDPTMGAVSDVWQIREIEVRDPPSEDAVLEALATSGVEKVHIDKVSKTAYVDDPRLKIDLGASAKGFIGDLAKNYLKERSVDEALLALGGNIVAIGDKKGEGYTIGVENPFDPHNSLLGTLNVRNTCVVTSGDYERYFTDSSGKRYHHILDPHTGSPADSGLMQVVVVSESGETADMLSTALFVLGREKAITFLKAYDPEGEIGVILTERNGDSFIRDNLKEVFTPESSEENPISITYFS